MAIFGRRQPHAPIILSQPVFGSRPPAGKIVSLISPSIASAVSRFHPRVQVSIIRAGGQPSVSKLVQISVQSINAGVRFPRPAKVIVSRAGGQPSVAKLFQISRPSLDAATRRFHPAVQIIVKKSGSPAVILPPIGKIRQVSQIAINTATRLFHPIVKGTISRAGGPASLANIPGSIFYVPTDPDAQKRTRSHLDAVQMILNSLGGQGYLRLSGLRTFTILPGCLQVARAPTPADDISSNIQVGMTWQNTVTGSFYICRSNAQGAAVWALLV